MAAVMLSGSTMLVIPKRSLYAEAPPSEIEVLAQHFHSGKPLTVQLDQTKTYL
jgi:hypothetical protein